MKNVALILSTRARNALYWHIRDNEPENLKTWQESTDPKIIAKYTSRELLRADNFGRVSLAEVIAWLDEFDLKLADDPASHRCPHCGQLMRNDKRQHV